MFRVLGLRVEDVCVGFCKAICGFTLWGCLKALNCLYVLGCVSLV